MAQANYNIGDEVVLSKEGRMNDSYEDFKDEVLIITHCDENDTGLGEEAPIYSFKIKSNGEDCPFSLYEYEFELY